MKKKLNNKTKNAQKYPKNHHKVNQKPFYD